jgi:exopolyphosphatase/guanosine-5'-triphosphate,3'-diphosphate pyrophosphatase
LEKFKPSEPISWIEVQEIENYLSKVLKPLWEAILKYDCKILIGSSGSFDTFADLILESRSPRTNLGSKKTFSYNLKEYFSIHDQLIRSTKSQRMKMPGMLEMRVDMIVLASLCCSLVLKKSAIKKMKLSAYSLKEGAFYEKIDNKKKLIKS